MEQSIPKRVNERLLNSLLASFLISKLPFEEQLVPRLWLHILHPPPLTCPAGDKKPQCEDIFKKDALARSFLLNLLNPPLLPPFNEPPFGGSLPNPPQVSTTTPDLKWAVELAGMSAVPVEDERASNSFPPVEFLNRQPKPTNGAFCYAAVFSDMSPTVTFRNM